VIRLTVLRFARAAKDVTLASLTISGSTPMPLQNRVTPFGDIIATPERGLFLGNRGSIHDPSRRVLLTRRWTTRAWIICVCEFRGRRRKVMATPGWTELFFLDEATAFAAGHRPCFYCRRADATAFRDAWAKGQGVARPHAPDMDAVLHAERLDGRVRRLHDLDEAIGDLPDGTMVQADDASLLVVSGRLLRWSPGGYHRLDAVSGDLKLLTPPSVVAALRAGYRAVLHSSAGVAKGWGRNS
jgi:hypothetical protein